MKHLRQYIRTVMLKGIALDLEIGDIILTGKFKNKRTVVKSIGKDEYGHPTINGKSILKFKIEKQLPKRKWSAKSRKDLREGLIKEGMKTVEELPDSVTVDCRRDRSAGGWWIEFNDPSFDATVWGSMLIARIPKGKYGNCDNAMRVMSVRTPHGWGPLLYDIAIEWATLKADGLIPDRMAVSRDANNVWDYYMNNRSDVKKTQLDNLKDSFKNGPQDDCEQLVGDIFNEDIPWQDSSMSKKYSKPPTTIDRLKKLGKWRLEK